MNRKDLCTAFARQYPARGRASSMHYDGRVAYSYGEHFLLAIITGNTATVNSDKYSSTTSRHQSTMRAALAAEGYSIVDADTATMKELARGAKA